MKRLQTVLIVLTCVAQTIGTQPEAKAVENWFFGKDDVDMKLILLPYIQEKANLQGQKVQSVNYVLIIPQQSSIILDLTVVSAEPKEVKFPCAATVYVKPPAADKANKSAIADAFIFDPAKQLACAQPPPDIAAVLC